MYSPYYSLHNISTRCNNKFTHFYCVDVLIGIRERIWISGTRGIFFALVACILGYFLLPLNLLYSNSVFSGLRGFPHSHVSVRVLPVGISVSHWHPRDLATTAALCTCCTKLITSRHKHICTEANIAEKSPDSEVQVTPDPGPVRIGWAHNLARVCPSVM